MIQRPPELARTKDEKKTTHTCDKDHVILTVTRWGGGGESPLPI